jgi:hypothetical protein
MFPIRFYDPMGLTDLTSGLLIFFTVSPIPTGVAEIHALFLIYKGLASIVRYIPMPMPVFYLGGFADLISASILFIGTPPILADYSVYLAGFLLLKGVWTSLVTISMA